MECKKKGISYLFVIFRRESASDLFLVGKVKKKAWPPGRREAAMPADALHIRTGREERDLFEVAVCVECQFSVIDVHAACFLVVFFRIL